MATKLGPALLAALVFGCAALGICPLDSFGRGSQVSNLAASTGSPPLSERGIACPIDDR